MHEVENDNKHNSHNSPKRIAIFVGFSKELTLSCKSYIESLIKANYRVLYVSNCRLSNQAKKTIASLAWKLIERHNMGRDIGAYRDAILWLNSQGFLESCELLIMANDSVQFLPGNYADSLVESLKRFEQSHHVALFSHISCMHSLHFQSFFQALKKSVFKSREFLNFWEKYMPLSHRGHCIFNGEIMMSQSIYNKLHGIQVLYTSSDLQANLEKQYSIDTGINAHDLLRLMPSPSRTIKRKERNSILEPLAEAAWRGEPLPYQNLYLISELIENSNPSHVGAFLFPFYLKCPFVKKDLCLAGSFSIAQAALLFREALESSAKNSNLAIDINAHAEEYNIALYLKGTPMSHESTPGATTGFIYSDIYDGSP